MLNLEKLATVRKEKKTPQHKLAQELGISQQQYSRYETGQFPMPLETFAKICEKLNVSADYLLDLKIFEEDNYGKN